MVDSGIDTTTPSDSDEDVGIFSPVSPARSKTTPSVVDSAICLDSDRQSFNGHRYKVNRPRDPLYLAREVKLVLPDLNKDWAKRQDGSGKALKGIRTTNGQTYTPSETMSRPSLKYQDVEDSERQLVEVSSTCLPQSSDSKLFTCLLRSPSHCCLSLPAN